MKYKAGRIVAVCYDGKWSRAVEARIVAVTPHWIDLEFVPWANEEAGIIKMRAFNEAERKTTWSNRTKRRSRRNYAGWVVGTGENGIMRWLGCHGDFYRVVDCKILLDNYYTVAKLGRPIPARETSDDIEEMTSTSVVSELRSIL